MSRFFKVFLRRDTSVTYSNPGIRYKYRRELIILRLYLLTVNLFTDRMEGVCNL